MKILIVNAGSSSLKYQLVDMNGEVVLAKGLVARIGLQGSSLEQKRPGDEEKYIIACDIFSIASGIPLNSSACAAATACSMAPEFARPTSSELCAIMRRTIMRGSTPAYIMREHQ